MTTRDKKLHTSPKGHAMKGVLACLVAVLAVAVCLSRTVAPIGGSSDVSQDGAPTAVARTAQATLDSADGIPSASTVTGDEFLAALDAYVDANPEADQGDYVELNGGVPSFGAQDATTEAFQSFSELDGLGRCGAAFACLGPETLPTSERGDISEVHPSGWRHDDYDFVDGGSLYNRSHLIAFSLSGQNANERNLITGTRHMNANVMEPIESMVRDYIEQSGNHVLYRVTPVFEGNELVARGVQMEALSMEDAGQGVSLNVYLRNFQPGVAIDYATGDNRADDAAGTESEGMTGSRQIGDEGIPTGTASKQANPGAATVDEASGNEDTATGQVSETANPTNATAAGAEAPATGGSAADPSAEPSTVSYVVNTNTGKFHLPSCPSVSKIKDENRLDSGATRDELIAQGYAPCKNCNP